MKLEYMILKWHFSAVITVFVVLSLTHFSRSLHVVLTGLTTIFILTRREDSLSSLPLSHLPSSQLEDISLHWCYVPVCGVDTLWCQKKHDLSRSHPPKHWPHPLLLNFDVQMETSAIPHCIQQTVLSIFYSILKNKETAVPFKYSLKWSE